MLKLFQENDGQPTLLPKCLKKLPSSNSIPNTCKNSVENGTLKVFSNGEIIYKLKGILCKASVIWNFEAPQGAGDTHYSIMRGTNCNLVIKQGAEQRYKPTLYIEPTKNDEIETFTANLEKAVNQDLAATYPGIQLAKVSENFGLLKFPTNIKLVTKLILLR